ncbi:hypothetical protein SKAU_G00125340 [Synaphobranchus kaupii]|uniref:Uncharacterized protein n=1 Tax=Synaphobranchus kaupii TaxID=118154 RepID=A0A9Q1FPI6_SYNKA|nr:hypothetical protein SKAU_G00125340 [Synaphobranchus kaupii]
MRPPQPPPPVLQPAAASCTLTHKTPPPTLYCGGWAQSALAIAAQLSENTHYCLETAYSKASTAHQHTCLNNVRLGATEGPVLAKVLEPSPGFSRAVSTGGRVTERTSAPDSLVPSVMSTREGRGASCHASRCGRAKRSGSSATARIVIF